MCMFEKEYLPSDWYYVANILIADVEMGDIFNHKIIYIFYTFDRIINW